MDTQTKREREKAMVTKRKMQSGVSCGHRHSRSHPPYAGALK